MLDNEGTDPSFEHVGAGDYGAEFDDDDGVHFDHRGSIHDGGADH